jgi:hypothetical protein
VLELETSTFRFLDSLAIRSLNDERLGLDRGALSRGRGFETSVSQLLPACIGSLASWLVARILQVNDYEMPNPTCEIQRLQDIHSASSAI